MKKIETFQAFNSISAMESLGIPVYVHPNKGVGPTLAPYDLGIRVEYRNVNGTLHIGDYYSAFGTVGYQRTQKLEERDVTGNGTTTFVTTHNYVGVHVVNFTPDFSPSPPIEIKIYTINYEVSPHKELTFFSLAATLIGAILTATGITLASVANRSD